MAKTKTSISAVRTRFQTVCRFVGVWEVLYGREIVNQSAGFFRMDGMNGRKLYEAKGEYFDHYVEAERHLQSQVIASKVSKSRRSSYRGGGANGAIAHG